MVNTWTPQGTVATAEEISARLERLPLSRWHVKTRVLVGVATFFDGFDQLMIAYALPVLIPYFALNPDLIAWTIAIGGIGMLFGALAGGWLADRVGRVPVLIAALTVYAVTSVLMAGTTTLWLFLAIRFVQGFGLGAEVPVAATYIGEITRAHKRGRFVLLYELIFPAWSPRRWSRRGSSRTSGGAGCSPWARSRCCSSRSCAACPSRRGGSRRGGGSTRPTPPPGGSRRRSRPSGARCPRRPSPTCSRSARTGPASRSSSRASTCAAR
jgi:hypothetical protein